MGPSQSKDTCPGPSQVSQAHGGVSQPGLAALPQSRAGGRARASCDTRSASHGRGPRPQPQAESRGAAEQTGTSRVQSLLTKMALSSPAPRPTGRLVQLKEDMVGSAHSTGQGVKVRRQGQPSGMTEQFLGFRPSGLHCPSGPRREHSRETV